MRPSVFDQNLTIQRIEGQTLAAKYARLRSQAEPVEHSTTTGTICPIVTARKQADLSGLPFTVALSIPTSKARTRLELHTEISQRLHKMGLRLHAVIDYGTR